MIRFMSDTRYAGLEKEMQHIPGFRPRRSGMVISHLSGCLENQRSPCERRVTDCVPFYELLEVLAEEVAVSTFVSRVCRLTGRRNPCFFQSGHRERFLAMGEKCNRAIEEAATCSAVYLLSADRFLCSRALAAIDQEGFIFPKFISTVLIWMATFCFIWQGICIREAVIFVYQNLQIQSW